jgi:hypothetical protein
VVVWRVPSIDGTRPQQLLLRGSLLVALYVPSDKVRSVLFVRFFIDWWWFSGASHISTFTMSRRPTCLSRVICIGSIGSRSSRAPRRDAARSPPRPHRRLMPRFRFFW